MSSRDGSPCVTFLRFRFPKMVTPFLMSMKLKNFRKWSVSSNTVALLWSMQCLYFAQLWPTASETILHPFCYFNDSKMSPKPSYSCTYSISVENILIPLKFIFMNILLTVCYVINKKTIYYKSYIKITPGLINDVGLAF